jgi:hypothetical protein
MTSEKCEAEKAWIAQKQQKLEHTHQQIEVLLKVDC